MSAAELPLGPGPLEPEVDAAPDSLGLWLARAERDAKIWEEVFGRLGARPEEPLEYGDPLDALADHAGLPRQGPL